MGKASKKETENNPSLNDEILGFKENGKNITIPLSSIKNLIESSLSGISNVFTFSNDALSIGRLTTDSSSFDLLTSITINNKNSEGLDMVDFFTLISENKNILFLKLIEVGFEVTAMLKISDVIFNNDGTTKFLVSVHKSLKRKDLVLGALFTLNIDLENDRFSDTQGDRLKDSVYEELTKSLSVSPTSFEKGVSTDLTFTWNVNKNDDTLNTVTLDGQDKLSEATGVNRTYEVDNQVNSKSISLVITATKNNTTGGSNNSTTLATSTAIVPQYYGKIQSAEPSYEYDDLANHSKLVQSSASFSFSDNYSGYYAFVLSTKSNPTITTEGFALTIGDFNSSEYWLTKQVTVKLEDGTDQTMYLFRTRELQIDTFTFNIS